jgi:hypothetical protein
VFSSKHLQNTGIPEMITYGAQNINDNVRHIFQLGGYPFVQSTDNELFVCRKEFNSIYSLNIRNSRTNINTFGKFVMV